jgi:alkylation response protein AidB-like acyl-CoA dehydrogenase
MLICKLGITLGDIGHKLGMNAYNNGFAAFNKVRIPRNHMLMKNAQVLPVSKPKSLNTLTDITHS